jgi:hypothetical protein
LKCSSGLARSGVADDVELASAAAPLSLGGIANARLLIIYTTSARARTELFGGGECANS